jgi:hypothetical protein
MYEEALQEGLHLYGYCTPGYLQAEGRILVMMV